MQTPAQSFLTPDDQQRISDCVHEAEKQTSGEIVPMVVSESHNYPQASGTGAAIIALPIALLASRLIGSYFWIGPNNTYLFIVCFCLLYVVAHPLVTRTPWLKRLFLLPQHAEEQVQAAAITSFYSEKLYRTRAQNGILLFISVFERRVWVLADSGINEKIPQQRWQEIVDLVTDGIKDKRQCQAISEAVTRIGAILKEFFPIEQDDKNELHNLIIR